MVDRRFSAFGSTEPLFDPPGERIRWCCPEWIDAEEKLQRVMAIAGQAGSRSGASRISVRVFSSDDLADRFNSLLSESRFRVEAVIDPQRADRCRITYLGWCDRDRQDVEADATREQSLVESVTRKAGADSLELEDPPGIQDIFELQECSGQPFSPADTADLIKMHGQNFARFPYPFKEKLAIMREDPQTYIQVVLRSRLDGKIHAFSNLELNPVRLLDGRTLLLAEYDNTMKRMNINSELPSVDGIGRTIRFKLAMLAARRGVDFCYSESRSGLIAINQISHQIGMKFGGKLLKHLLIAGESDIAYQAPSRFESMNVWYFDESRLSLMRNATG